MKKIALGILLAGSLCSAMDYVLTSKDKAYVFPEEKKRALRWTDPHSESMFKRRIEAIDNDIARMRLKVKAQQSRMKRPSLAPRADALITELYNSIDYLQGRKKYFEQKLKELK
jgi:hypothetical protein